MVVHRLGSGGLVRGMLGYWSSYKVEVSVPFLVYVVVVVGIVGVVSSVPKVAISTTPTPIPTTTTPTHLPV